MNNNDFLKELEFFNKNPDKAKTIDRSLIISVFFVEMVFFIILTASINIPDFIGISMLVFILFSMISLFLYIEKKNARFESFGYSKYTEKPSDLFGNLDSPDVAEYLEEIKQELEYYSGIRGFVAFNICSRMNDPSIKEQRLKEETVKKMIEEIDTIQKRT